MKKHFLLAGIAVLMLVARNNKPASELTSPESGITVEVYTNELGTDEILIRIGSENRSESFAKEIKDLFRSKVRVAPTINFESAEYIAKIQMPPMSRKSIKFIDLR